MKPPTFAPFFACLYPALCDVARKNGYALAIHGTVTADLDLIAVPWTDQAIDGEALKDALMNHIGSCGYDDLLRRAGIDEDGVSQIMAAKDRDITGAQLKPHGRRAWNLYLDAGAKVDLSVLPLANVQAQR